MRSNIENVQITSEGIKNSIKKYKPLQSIAEYVWNGFDAGASRVDITIPDSFLDIDAHIRIRDNGEGINRELLSQKFKPFFQSEKIFDPDSKNSLSHGKNGVGRLTFHTFANKATWQTTYSHDGILQSYQIEINSANLETYIASDPVIAYDALGTEVVFTDLITQELTEDTVRNFLAPEFCWFLELHREPGYTIYINGKLLDYGALETTREEEKYIHKQSETQFYVTYICWTRNLTEYSKYYFITSKNIEYAKENTRLNNKGDKFYHSVYIRSSLFDCFDVANVDQDQTALSEFKNRNSEEFRFIMDEVNKHLYDMRRPFLKQTVSKVIDDLEIDEAFPEKEKAGIIYQYKKDQLEDMISALYMAQPKLFTQQMNKEQRKTFIRLLDLIMETGEIDSLFHVFNEILDMSEAERRDLAEILKYSHLSNITKTIKLLADRYQAIADLKQLALNIEMGANEVDHLQKMIERHYWIFGEQYSLVTAAEPNFEEALRRYNHILYDEDDKIEIDHPDKYKQMDIFAVRQDLANGCINNIVVELKHPRIALGEKQLSQVKRYMRTILAQDGFNASNMTWEFYLVGNKFSNDGYIEGELGTNQNHGERFLVFKQERYKIYVMRWSEIFADFELRHDFLNKKLAIERTALLSSYKNANEIIAAQINSTASAPPEHKI